MASCKVCWTCRGLFLNDVSETEISAHIKTCRPAKNNLLETSEPIEYFVCDKSDFYTLGAIKDTLRKHARKIFSSLHIQKVLPHPLIKTLLSLCVSDRPIKHGKVITERPAANKNAHHQKYIDVQINGKVDKECQTTIHTHDTPNLLNSSLRQPDLHHESVVNDKLDNLGTVQSNSVRNTLTSPCADKLSYVVMTGNNSQDGLIKLATQCDVVKEDLLSLYVCKLCTHKSKSDQLMLRHLKSHNDGQMFVCSECNYSTIWRKDWKIHSQHHQNKKLKCPVCVAEFTEKDDFSLHLTTYHSMSETQKYKCIECNYQAKSLTSFKEHRRKHTGEVFKCPHQGCTFQSMYGRSLQKHLKQKHSLEKTKTCHVCGFQTKHASSLSKHMMLHSEFKPYKCSQCTFTGLYPSEVILHAKRKHLKQKMFSCPTCSFQTSYPWAIQKHITLHDGKKGYVCSVCGDGMYTLQKAKKHMMNSHGCENYEILSEPLLKKVKPSDYEIKYKQNVDLDSMELVVPNDTILNESANKKKENVELNKSKVEEQFLDSVSQTMNQDTVTTDTNQFSGGAASSKGGNPMLCATANNLMDVDNSLTEDSLFDLMSDFPRPPTLNRCQSASTLMFASFSPHLIDRPLTPDFFTDSPSVGSFFPTFSSKHIETDTLNLGNFESASHQLSVPPSTNNHLSSLRGPQTLSPMLPSFASSPGTGTLASMSAGRLNASPAHDPACMDIMIPNAVLANMSQLNDHNSAAGKNGKMDVMSKSAFTSLGESYSPEIEAAIAGIPLSEECQTNSCLIEESPFPTNTVLKSNMFNL
ncbi:zinc finger X-chromosomal protein [Biomphalaria glabrata]|nr:zinc finger X-chromosomal protein [Biomphalaria glabrata]